MLTVHVKVLILLRATAQNQTWRNLRLAQYQVDNARRRFRTWKPPLCKGRWHGLPWRRGCWELKCLLPGLDELCAARWQTAPSAIARDLEKWFDCSFFYAFFLPEKESVGKKSRHKGDCAAIRFAPIRRSFPLMYPPDDCSADSESISLYPKRSSGTTTPVSKRKVSRLPP